MPVPVAWQLTADPSPGVLRRTFDRLPLPPANIAGLVAASVLDRVHPWRLPGSAAGYRSAGGVIMVSGCLLAGWATAVRREPDLQRPEGVTRTGPYRFGRHPMYVGWHLVHLGAALSRRSGWGLVALVAAVAEVDREVRREERELAEQFGRSYQDYAATVPRYF